MSFDKWAKQFPNFPAWAWVKSEI